jgi:hypothetical protein
MRLLRGARRGDRLDRDRRAGSRLRPVPVNPVRPEGIMTRKSGKAGSSNRPGTKGRPAICKICKGSESPLYAEGTLHAGKCIECVDAAAARVVK